MQYPELSTYDWEEVFRQLEQTGFALLKGVLSPASCTELINSYDDPAYFRKTILMARFQFGRGEYKYFAYPLVPWIAKLRGALYTQLSPIARDWMARLRIETQYPGTWEEWAAQCHQAGQAQCTVLMLKYGPGDYNCLHQDVYGSLYFPVQAAIFLNQAGSDYTGGEFVMTEQRPRAQSKAWVIQPDLGDMLLFTTQFRPQAGTRGYYRLPMKHGVSEIRSGQRHTLGIILHDAQT